MEFEKTKSWETTYLSEIFSAEDSEGGRYILKRNRGKLTETQVGFINWLVSERPEGFLIPLEVRVDENNRLEEVYDFINLPTLDKVLGPRKKPDGWTFFQALSVIRQLTASLGVMHDQGFIHHDVRRKNLFIDPESLEVTLFDYNSVKRPYWLGDGRDSWNDVPPECRSGNSQISFPFDVYQAGVLFRKMTHSYDLELGRWVLRVDDNPEVALQIIGKAMHEQQEERFANCKELNDALSMLR